MPTLATPPPPIDSLVRIFGAPIVALLFVIFVMHSLVACDRVEHEPSPIDTLGQLELRSLQPAPASWPAGDERGNGNTQGWATRLRCAAHLADPFASEYELSSVFAMSFWISLVVGIAMPANVAHLQSPRQPATA
jgi:hypothetical protein